MNEKVLVVDDEKSFRVIAQEALSGAGYLVQVAESGTTGAAAWRKDPADVVLLDRNLPDIDGVDLLAALSAEAQERGEDTLFLVTTAYADIENVVQALHRGAEDYLTKPIQLQDLLVKIQKALEARRLRNRVRALRHEGHAPPADALLTSNSPPMKAVLERAARVAQSPSTTLRLQGESGTGKEVLARFIHDTTPGRRDEAFVEVNCAALSEGLLESELFGHERGAFTDAKGSKRGLFEVAAGGTLFLDEIGEMGLGLQVKLLRALETTRFRRVGGTRDLQSDVRIIAATNRNLEEEVQAGRFRLDLFHRLDVFHLTLPPLRDRKEDIAQLARFLLERIAVRLGRSPPRLTPEAERVLLSYPYPGNVRELRNVLERALILEQGAEIRPDALVLGTLRLPSREQGNVFGMNLADDRKPPTLAELEKRYIEWLIELTGGNRSQVARILDVSYPTVAKKIADYDIKIPGRERPVPDG